MADNKTAVNSAHFDANQVPTMMGVIGSAGTSDTGGTAYPLPVGVREDTGALYVYNLGPAGNTTVSPNLPVIAGTPASPGTPLVVRLTDGTNYYNASGGGGGTNVNIVTGTINSDTVVGGTLQNLVSGTINSGTIVGLPLEVTGSATALNGDLISSTDVQNYRWFSIQIINTWVGSITLQVSNDNTNFVTLPYWNTTSLASQASNLITANAIFHGPLSGRYFRARMTSFTSGTGQAIAEFYAMPTTPVTTGVAAAQNGGWNVSVTSLSASGGTVLKVGTVGTIENGTLALVTTVSNLTNGSVNILTGTVNALASGTITGGTLQLGTVTLQPLAIQVDTSDTTNGTIYVGQAAVGQGTGAATWQIKKILTGVAAQILYAGGSATFTNVYGTRTGYTYS